LRRLTSAAIIATLLWIPLSMRTSVAIYCYPGDPPEVYQACVNYNNGIGQQVTNEQQLESIQAKITDQCDLRPHKQPQQPDRGPERADR
jgi:hypothetical protein